MKVSKVLLAMVVAAMVASVYSQDEPDPSVACAQLQSDSNWGPRCRSCNGNTDCLTCVGIAYDLGTLYGFQSTLNVADRCSRCNGNPSCLQCIERAFSATRTGDTSATLSIADRCGSCNGNENCYQCVAGVANLGDTTEAVGMADRCSSCNGNAQCTQCVSSVAFNVRDASTALPLASRCSSCNGNADCISCVNQVVSYYYFGGLDTSTALNTAGRCISCNGNQNCLTCVNYAVSLGGDPATRANLLDRCTQQPSNAQCAAQVTAAAPASVRQAAVSIEDRCSINNCGSNNLCSTCLQYAAIAGGDVMAADRCTQVVGNAEATACVTYIARAGMNDLGNRAGYLDNCRRCSNMGFPYACGACNTLAYLLQDNGLASKCPSLPSNGCGYACQICLVVGANNYVSTGQLPTSGDIAACFAQH